MTHFEVLHPGLLDYDEAWQLQRSLHRERVAEARGDVAVLLEHPSVYTAGRRTEAHERPVSGARVVDVDRGGKITWHGPGQLVGYPIMRLAEPIDVVAYVRAVEELLINVCGHFGVSARRIAGRSGAWLPAANGHPDRKIGAIGIRVANGVTLHGFALNCNPDLSAFDQIVPCGIDDAAVTSLSVEAGRLISVAEVLPLVEEGLEVLAALAAPQLVRE